MIENDTWYRCTVCGRVGTVGRCCGDETREPLNDLARREQEKIKSQNMEKPDANSLLADVLLEIEKLEDWKDVKELKFMADKIRQEHFS